MSQREVHKAARQIASECYASRGRALGRGLTRIYDEKLRPFGLTVAQLNLLVAISLLQETRPADLAEHLNLEKSTLSRNLARMVDQRWISAVSQGREQRLSIEPAGETLLHRAYPAWRQAQQQARRQLDDAVLAGLAKL